MSSKTLINANTQSFNEYTHIVNFGANGSASTYSDGTLTAPMGSCTPTTIDDTIIHVFNSNAVGDIDINGLSTYDLLGYYLGRADTQQTYGYCDYEDGSVKWRGSQFPTNIDIPLRIDKAVCPWDHTNKPALVLFPRLTRRNYSASVTISYSDSLQQLTYDLSPGRPYVMTYANVNRITISVTAGSSLSPRYYLESDNVTDITTDEINIAVFTIDDQTKRAKIFFAPGTPIGEN